MKLLIPLFAGLFFIIGSLITKIFKTKDNMYLFSVGIAFITLLGIAIFDLLPEVFEIFEDIPYGDLIVIFIIISGFIFFGILDSFSHHHEHKHSIDNDNKKEHNDHLFHIGLTTTIAIVLHNVVEGAFIYMGSVNSIKTSLVLAFAVGLHNIPLGMEISSSVELSKKGNNKKNLLISLLVISTFIGGIIGYIFDYNLNINILGTMLAITTGMSLYIVFFELFREIISHKFSKHSIYGIICGSVLLIITFLI